MVNVPMGVWIDEKGRIVRPPEPAYSRDVALLSIKVEGSRYVAALRDWVANGEKSPHVLTAARLRERLAPRPAAHDLADAHFKLGVHFHAAGKTDLAGKHWKEAQRLHPDSWNFHRQDWSFTPNASKNWLEKFRASGDKPYYPPLELPAVPGKKSER